MVAVSGESPLDLQGVLSTLESKSSSNSQRLEAYTKLTAQLVDGQLSIFDRDIQEHGGRLLKVAQRDVGSPGVDNQVVQKALHVLTYCLQEKEIVGFVAGAELSSILKLLCGVATDAAEAMTCTSALRSFARQNISHAIVSAEFTEIVAALKSAKDKWKSAVDHEVLSVLLRLCEQCGKSMEQNCSGWGRLAVSLLVAPTPKVRERAFEIVQKWTSALSSSAEFVKSTVQDFKPVIVPELQRLFKEDKKELYVVKICELLVRIFYAEMHQTRVLNVFMSPMELAFRSSHDETRARAFQAWSVFVTTMAQNSDFLSDPKRLNLVMMVFLKDNAHTEAVQLEKVQAWWRVVCCLDARLWDNFDVVVKPLLRACVGNPSLCASGSGVPGTPSTPRMVREICLKSPSTPKSSLSVSGTLHPPVVQVQLMGLEILARLLADGSKPANISSVSMLEPLKAEVIASPTSFIKNSGILITAMFELIKNLGTEIREPLLMWVWQNLISQLRCALESSHRANERREPLSAFLGQFQVLVLSQVLSHRLVLKLYQSVCTLPHKILSSTAFSVTAQDVKGSPARFLCEVLLTPTLLKESTGHESFMSVLTQLVQCGTTTSPPAGVLDFCQGVVELLDRNAQFVPGPEVLWRLWSIVAHPLLEHISQSKEVNQGDSLEYNFDCLYSTLLLPVAHHLGATVSQPTSKTLMKTWSDLYRTFACLAALVPNAEANIVVETVGQRILEALQKENGYCLKDCAMLEYVMSICQVIVDSIDFSSVAAPQTFGLGLSASPSKWSRRKQKPMGNIHSFICLVAAVMEGIVEGVKMEGEEPPVFAKQKPSESAGQLSVAAITSLDVVTVLVTKINTSGIIGHMTEKLAAPLAGLFTASVKKTPVKLHTPAALQKLEKVWQDVCTMLQSGYSVYDSTLLASVAPLLQTTFLHPRRQIKNHAVAFWNATFSRSAPLTYPTDLQPVLMKVKEKTRIPLPGWVNVDVAVVEETPFSQMSQPDSMAPDPVIPGMPSPTRLRGSFLRKDTSPSPKAKSVSPAKRVNPSEHRPFGGSARKKLSVDFMPEEDFVVITNTPKKKRILTEHQKEILKEKAVIPAMYNNLDASQDVSLMSQFSTTDTQQDTLQTPPGTADCVIMVSSSQSQEKEGGSQSEKMTAPEDPAPGPALRRSSRRKSVHFEDESNTGAASKESDNSSCEQRRWRISSTEPCGGNVSQSASSLNKEIVISSKSSSDEDNVAKSGEEGKSPSLPSPQPNLLAAFGDKLTESVSSKDLTLSGKSSSDEEKKTENADENDPFFRPFKSLSQSPTRSHLAEKSIPDNSVRMMTRKTRSQEIVGSVKSAGKEPALKGTGDRPLFTSLDKWLRKTPAIEEKSPSVTEKTPASIEKSPAVTEKSPSVSDSTVTVFSKGKGLIPESPEMIVDSPSSSQPVGLLVEETQSPKDLAEKQKGNASVLETPTTTPNVSPAGPTPAGYLTRSAAGGSRSSEETSVVSKEITSVDTLAKEKEAADNSSKDDPLSSFGLKQPVIQLQKLSETDLATKTTADNVTLSPAPMEVDDEADIIRTSQDSVLQLDPSVLMDEDASHGIPTGVSMPESGGSSGAKNAKTPDNDNSDHDNLFGFSELLQTSDKDEKDESLASSKEKDAADKSQLDKVTDSLNGEEVPESENVANTDEEMSESLFTKRDEHGHYNPALTATLLETPPRRHLSLRSHQNRSDSPASSQSQGDGSQPTPSKASPQADSDTADFDPTKDSTLTEAGDHVNKRKQRTPKKIEFPEKLRRTPRRQKAKKSVCACCKDGAGSHHAKHLKETPQKEDKKGKSGSQSERDIPQKGGKVSSSQTSALSSRQEDGAEVSDVKPLLLTTDELLQRMEKEDSETEPDKKEKHAPSPQDLGEKTPELKSSSHITPVRKSTTKTKMEAAKRRSASKSLRSALEKSAASDSDSDDVPLSQLAQQSEEMTSVVEKGAPANEEEKAASATESARQVSTARVRSASKLRLKKLSRERLVHSLRSPPKLRLRQRKDLSGEAKGVGKSAEKTEQVEAEAHTKSLSQKAESQIERVASGKQPSQGHGESLITEFTSLSGSSGASKSTGKKAGRRTLLKRLSSSPSRHLKRLRTRSQCRLSSPRGARLHKKLFKTSPASTRQLRKRNRDSQEKDDKNTQAKKKPAETPVTEVFSDKPVEDKDFAAECHPPDLAPKVSNAEWCPPDLIPEAYDAEEHHPPDLAPKVSNAELCPPDLIPEAYDAEECRPPDLAPELSSESAKACPVQVEQPEPMETEAAAEMIVPSSCAEVVAGTAASSVQEERIGVAAHEENVPASTEENGAVQNTAAGIGSQENTGSLQERGASAKDRVTDYLISPENGESKTEDKEGCELPPSVADSTVKSAGSETKTRDVLSLSQQAEEIGGVAVQEEKSEETETGAHSEDMFDSLGFSLDQINSKQGQNHGVADADSVEALSAALFSEPDSQPGSVASVDISSLIGMLAQTDSQVENSNETSLVDVPTFGLSSSGQSQDMPVSEEEKLLSAVSEEDAGDIVPVNSALNNTADTTVDAIAPVSDVDSTVTASSDQPLCAASVPEVETQPATETSDPQKTDKCETSGPEAPKSQAEVEDQVESSVGKSVEVQTDYHRPDFRDAAADAPADEAPGNFSMLPRDAALKVTPLKRKRKQVGTLTLSRSAASKSSPLDPTDAERPFDSKMLRVRRLQQKFRTPSDRGMSMVRQSLLQRQLHKQFDGYPTTSQDSAPSPTKDSESGEKPAETVKPAPSPSASPSSSILKKRPLPDSDSGVSQDEQATPTKKRRVSFAEPIVSGESPSHEATLNKMPWRWESPFRKQSFPRGSLLMDDAEPSKSGASSASPQPSQPSPASQASPSSYHSTLESQLNATDPIFPELVDCDKSVEIVLPQLTSAAWYRGLNQLLAANGITTIGSLASQTEVEVQSMPFRAPKVEVVRGALQQYYRLHYAKKPAAKPTNNGNGQDKAAKPPDFGPATEEDDDVLPSAEEALRQLSPIKGESGSKDIEDADDFEDDNTTNIVQPMEDLDNEMATHARLSSTSSSAQTDKLSLLEKVSDIAETDPSELQRTNRDDLSSILHHLHALTASVIHVLYPQKPQSHLNNGQE